MNKFILAIALSIGLVTSAFAQEECKQPLLKLDNFVTMVKASGQNVTQKTLLNKEAVQSVVKVSEVVGIPAPDVDMDRVDYVVIGEKVLAVISLKGCIVLTGTLSGKVYRTVFGTDAGI